MNTGLKKKRKKRFKKDFFKLMNNAAFGITMANVKNSTDINLVTAKVRRSYLVSKSNYHIPKIFSEYSLAI